MKKMLLIGACLTLFAATGKAQQAAPTTQPYNFSLTDCIKYAYEHQDTVKNAQLDVASAAYKVKETIGTGLPQISGTVSFQDFLKAPATVGPDFSKLVTGGAVDPDAPLVKFPFGAVTYNNTFSVQAQQMIFSGTFLVGLKAAKTFKELYERSLTRSKIQTNVMVTKAYYQVLVGDEQVKLLDANIKQLKEQLNQTTQQNKQGFVEKIDVDRLSVQYNNLVTNRENVLRSITLYIQMLKFQMGMPIENELTLTDKLDNINLDKDVAQASIDTSFYHRRIEYNLLETNLKLNMLDVKSKKSEYLPSVVANAGLASVFQENHIKYLYNNSYPNSYIGLGISIPIYNGGQRGNQLKQLEINVQKVQNDMLNAKNGFSLQANAARITYMNGVQSLNNQKRNRDLAHEVLRVSTIKYQQGVGSSIEVTQAQTDLQNADNQYIQALYDALVSKVNLDQAYGRIN